MLLQGWRGLARHVLCHPGTNPALAACEFILLTQRMVLFMPTPHMACFVVHAVYGLHPQFALCGIEVRIWRYQGSAQRAFEGQITNGGKDQVRGP